MVDLLLTFLLLNIPTITLTLFVGLGLKESQFSCRRLLLTGVLLGVGVSVLRNLVPFGIHIPMVTLMLVIAIHSLGDCTWSVATLSGLVAHLISAVGEGLIFAPVFMLMGIPLREVVQNPWLVILGGWLANIPLLVVAGIIACRYRGREKAVDI